MEFSQVDIGATFDLIGKVLIFDLVHSSHLMQTRYGGTKFAFEGLLTGGFHSFTLLNVCLRQQFPMPIVSATKDTQVLGHHVPTWTSLHSVVDLCCGFGGLAQGATAAGFEVVTAVDQNKHMVSLHTKVHDAVGIVGDFGTQDTIVEIWKASRGASVIASGFSCQPYSSLGDGKGALDSRANCLTKTLNAAMCLHAYAVILECVAPAAQDSFVKGEIQGFCNRTGFTCSQIELRLDQTWPCRRHRAWWLLTAPELGEIKLYPWKALDNLWAVQQIIPEIRLWDVGDEKQLMLDDHELEAFGVSSNMHAKHMLNMKGVAPCALHAWGSQLRACPCGCRQYGFSSCRLAAKGLHGCLVRSAVQLDGSTLIRHIHPNEAMGLNSMDPVLDFGDAVGLTLSAVGQLASPIQALWVFGFLDARLNELQKMPVFTPDAQIQAYRSWMLMRCRQVWPPNNELIQDAKLLAMMGFWDEFKDLSIAELVFPLRWEGKIVGPVHVASILDFLIRSKERVPETISDASDEPTPWMDCPSISDDPTTVGCMQADSCTVVFEDSEDSPIRFQPRCCATVSQFLHAQAQLVETLDVESITMNGRTIPLDHVMEVGQLIVIRTRKLDVVYPAPDDPIVSPTADWTQPIQDPVEVASPPRKMMKISKFDVGECTLPTGGGASDQPWLDATPFMHLQGEQFLKLSLPSVTTTQQLWSVRHQFFRSDDRIKILEAQQQYWADDEIRFHLQALTKVFRDHQLKGTSPVVPLCVIDPLVFTSWVGGKGFDCRLWAKDHPEILQQGIPIVTVALIAQHWIPVYMTPVPKVLHASTWDKAEATHEGLNHVVQAIAAALGFESALIQREHRLFFTSELCGSLAIAFLRSELVGTLLPTDCHEAAAIHAMLRARYTAALQGCDIVDRPWIWGAGDSDPVAPQSPIPDTVVPVVNVTRDQRIDLLNEKGMLVADDEVRFHLLNLIEKQPVTSTLLGRSFTFLEPLVYNCWSSIGKIIVAQWCERNREVSSQGVNVITAFSVDDHWIPIWFSPRCTVLQVHMIQAEGIDFSRVEEIVEHISNALGFMSFALHRIPDSLPEHGMCGAFAMCFLAHVVMGMPLPTDLASLRTLHTNMRASFVAHLYSCETTPRPVIWGLGKKAQGDDNTPFGAFAAAEAEINRWMLAQPSELPLPPGLIATQANVAGAYPDVEGSNGGQAKRPVSPLDVAAGHEPDARGPHEHGYETLLQGSARSECPSNAPGHEAHAYAPINETLRVPVDRSSGSSSWESRPLPRMPVETETANDAPVALENSLIPSRLGASSCDLSHTEEAHLTAGAAVRESGPLPRMPVEERRTTDAGTEGFTTSGEASSGSQGPITRVAEPPPSDPIITEQRRNRLRQITSHSYAMADDEMQFQLHHLIECHNPDDARRFMVAPCLGTFQWTLGESATLEEWVRDQWLPREDPNMHLFVALLVEAHWIPIWFAPGSAGFHAHTLANFASDEPLIDSILHLFASKVGMTLHVIHRAPHGIDIDRLCGTMTVSFFAHVMLRTVLPRTIEDLYARCWKMKETFARSLYTGPVTQPTVWGWGLDWECRPLPIMPAWNEVVDFITSMSCFANDTRCSAFVEVSHSGMPVPVGMTYGEMVQHVDALALTCPCGSWKTVVGRAQLETLLGVFAESDHQFLCVALLCQFHWSPVIALKFCGSLLVFLEEGVRFCTKHRDVVFHFVQVGAETQYSCGVATWKVLAKIRDFSEIVGDVHDVRVMLFHRFPSAKVAKPLVGFAPHGQLIKNLCAELAKHGVPESQLEERAQAVLKALGSEQLLTAMNHRQPWRQLKALGNNSRFQFVLPSELSKVVETQKGRPVVKGKGKGKSKSPPQPTDIDPTKLQVLDGTFRSQDRVLSQLNMKQIGPLSSGVILMNMQDAEPYLKSGKLVSQEPLALIVLHRAGMQVDTSLPHAPVSVPCRCMVDSEPVLVDAVLVQVGNGLVEKATGTAVLTVDTPEVVTLKLLVYKDELSGDWEEFCQSPIKCLVSLMPMLKRCFTDNCQCDGWHNPENLPLRDPIIDVWRRQYLRQGFKPCPPAQAEIFSVCIRIPICLLETMLSASGVSGVYSEPRTADGRDVLPAYTVIWTPKHSLQEMKHLMQTNPAVIGLARLADRRGLRVHSAQAKTIHQIVKPDTVYLPRGPKTVYTVGPFPYGVDRQAVGRILQKAGWESRPLQPATPCPGKGVMWLVQSAEEPNQTIIPTTTGEIMIAKVKQEVVSPTLPPMTLGSAATLALCGKPADGKQTETDPWAHHDPWKRYHPTGSATSGPNEGLQQIEDRIQTAVLAKIQPPMEQDDLPDRVHTLEGQVQHLIAKQQGLENQFQEHSNHHTQQITALQGQVSAQAQQLHGHLENQNQTMQSLFEQQMQQIRGLLAKRPREEGME